MKKLGFAVVLTLAVACGGDDGDGGGSYGDPIPNAQAEAAGTMSVDGAADLTGLGANPADDGAVGQSFAVYGHLSQMASIKQSNAVPTALTGGEGTRNAEFPGCVSSNGNTATYTDCDSGDATINGTVTGSETNVDIDLTIDTSQATIDMDGDLDFSATSLSGYLKYTTSIEAAGMSIDTVYDGQYDVTLDGQGCAVGGQVEVHYTVSGGAGIDVWAKAEFGPNCGDVTFY
ncbi:MAG: hypothetical protein KJO07_16285 [Deltaproteobacteria bacterium]|nr:hypothetical protein [Deltaproteobacteria bacterium]